MKTATMLSCRVSPTALIEMLEDIARERNLRDWTHGNFPDHEGRSTWEPLKRTAKNLGFISENGNHPTGLLVEYCDSDPRARKALLAAAFKEMTEPALSLGPESSLDDLYQLLGDLSVSSLDKSRLFLVGMADYLNIEVPISWRTPHPASRRLRSKRKHEREDEDFIDATDTANRERAQSKFNAGPPEGKPSSKSANSITSQPEFDRLLRLQGKVVSQLPDSPSLWGPRLLPVLEIMIDYLMDQEGSTSNSA